MLPAPLVPALWRTVEAGWVHRARGAYHVPRTRNRTLNNLTSDRSGFSLRNASPYPRKDKHLSIIAEVESEPVSPPAPAPSTSSSPPGTAAEADATRAQVARMRTMLAAGVPADVVLESFPSVTPSSSSFSASAAADPASGVPVPDCHPVRRAAPGPGDAQDAAAAPTKLTKDRPRWRKGLFGLRQYSGGPPKTKVKVKEKARHLSWSRPETLPPPGSRDVQVVGVSASAGMQGKGKSGRFVEGDIPWHNIPGAFGGRLV
ncbi:uncharacterized protein BXZ73DRAFT_103007 [Epithele typhae]|uniref:uncharacterized protein n=1 Tax=Epithele typhae TaxID=378194 RepID=UPI002007BB6C|nr:uncharacterized protein BXZ73DRAFT_103007 [Epithele typhae]KAH9926326.1 hypothetical protein BXZ73DRAFT_103007 [Epithele typhae]